MAGTLETSDVRALLRLVGEVRELGESPAAWRAHLAQELGKLCGARAVISSELAPRPQRGEADAAAASAGSCQAAVAALVLAHSGLDATGTDDFFRDVLWYDHRTERTLAGLVPLYGSTFVRARAELATDAAWYGSSLASERFRRHDCDDFIIAMCAVPAAGAICSLELFRPWRAPRFGERERSLVQLAHEELARDFTEAARAAQTLPRRQRQVLALLRRGLAEKEVAAELQVSTHTVHDYVKALYKSYRVSSRSELLAKAAPGSSRRAGLRALGREG